MTHAKKKYQNSTALVLGGYVNAYSIVKELYEQGVENIAMFDYGISLTRFSNKVNYRAKIDKTSATLLKEISALYRQYDYIVIFPTNDLQIKNLHDIYDKISDYCYLPFNRETVIVSSDKFFQYRVCEKIGIPYPKTVNVKQIGDLEAIGDLTFPLLVKPSRRDLTVDIFRTLYFETLEDYLDAKIKLAYFILKKVEFVVSEYIPGDDTHIFAYTCFRSQEGNILNEWTGKKLNQYPDNFGVFCSASNEAPQEVLRQGRALVEAFNAFGVVEPEFKYDYRDGKFKMMETNFRSMMWHRAGSISGVKLHETQFNYATGQIVKNYQQDKEQSIHFVLMLHEIPNLIARKGYWKQFRKNVFAGNKRGWAILDWRDIKPFWYALVLLVIYGLAACLRRFGLR